MSGPLALVVARTWDGAPARPDEQVQLWVDSLPERLRIRVEAPYHGDPAPPGAPGPFWGLWEHEVVELFVLGPGERYTEIELGPHGHHLVLRLDGVRRPVETLLPIEYQARIRGDRWEGEALLSRALLPPGPHRLNAYAIHGLGSARRYLAWTPAPGEGPDFHRLDVFPPVDLP